jgi:predicted lipoprotein with Yx(FWY)xxD motif
VRKLRRSVARTSCQTTDLKEVGMERVGKLRASLIVAIAVAVGLTVTLLLVTRSSNASSDAKSRAVVKVERNSKLGKRILVTRNGGLTLYSLSAERHGRFICTTSMCLSLWKPLVTPAGVKPTGVSGLSTVKRPDGRRQVAYRGAPLYRFVQDTKAGQVTGNGFRDVGVWRPVVAGAKPAATAPAPAQPTQSSNPYGY